MSTVVLGLYLAVAGELHQVVKYEKRMSCVQISGKSRIWSRMEEPTSYLVKDAGKRGNCAVRKLVGSRARKGARRRRQEAGAARTRQGV